MLNSHAQLQIPDTNPVHDTKIEGSGIDGSFSQPHVEVVQGEPGRELIGKEPSVAQPEGC